MTDVNMLFTGNTSIQLIPCGLLWWLFV